MEGTEVLPGTREGTEVVPVFGETRTRGRSTVPDCPRHRPGDDVALPRYPPLKEKSPWLCTGEVFSPARRQGCPDAPALEDQSVK